MEDKKSYLQRIADQLKQWDHEIEELKAKAIAAKAESKAEILKQIEELRLKKKTAQGKLIQLRKAGDEAWDTMKSGLERSLSEFKGAFSKSVAKFK
jgi:ABC-type phosphate transport system auxiliary subunit